MFISGFLYLKKPEFVIIHFFSSFDLHYINFVCQQSLVQRTTFDIPRNDVNRFSNARTVQDISVNTFHLKLQTQVFLESQLRNNYIIIKHEKSYCNSRC